ncbi:unnamed protein product [Paramecium sonneborni]|uniref:Uncharacterized protein n=1 Tax=Paramecium sonneborni TaxID=65129 RepID=A0A8S1PC77_9CILI|nr:unnamed protein product [Paramecium sonneborni]
MLNTSSINLGDSSKVYKQSNQLGILSTAISKIGNADHSFHKGIKAANTTNVSPVRMRLFRESPERKQRGLDGLVVGEFHPRKQTQVVYSSIHQSSSPMNHKPQQKQQFQDSPTRAKQKIDRFKNWDSKLDIELQLQNTGITRLGNDVVYQSGPQINYTKSIQFNERLNRNNPSVSQSDIVQLTAKLNAIPRTELTNFTRGHAHELSTLQQSLQRILKSSKAY